MSFLINFLFLSGQYIKNVAKRTLMSVITSPGTNLHHEAAGVDRMLLIGNQSSWPSREKGERRKVLAVVGLNTNREVDKFCNVVGRVLEKPPRETRLIDSKLTKGINVFHEYATKTKSTHNFRKYNPKLKTRSHQKSNVDNKILNSLLFYVKDAENRCTTAHILNSSSHKYTTKNAEKLTTCLSPLEPHKTQNAKIPLKKSRSTKEVKLKETKSKSLRNLHMRLSTIKMLMHTHRRQRYERLLRLTDEMSLLCMQRNGKSTSAAEFSEVGRINQEDVRDVTKMLNVNEVAFNRLERDLFLRLLRENSVDTSVECDLGPVRFPSDCQELRSITVDEFKNCLSVFKSMNEVGLLPNNYIEEVKRSEFEKLQLVNNIAFNNLEEKLSALQTIDSLAFDKIESARLLKHYLEENFFVQTSPVNIEFTEIPEELNDHIINLSELQLEIFNRQQTKCDYPIKYHLLVTSGERDLCMLTKDETKVRQVENKLKFPNYHLELTEMHEGQGLLIPNRRDEYNIDIIAEQEEMSIDVVDLPTVKSEKRTDLLAVHKMAQADSIVVPEEGTVNKHMELKFENVDDEKEEEKKNVSDYILERLKENLIIEEESGCSEGHDPRVKNPFVSKSFGFASQIEDNDGLVRERIVANPFVSKVYLEEKNRNSGLDLELEQERPNGLCGVNKSGQVALTKNPFVSKSYNPSETNGIFPEEEMKKVVDTVIHNPFISKSYQSEANIWKTSTKEDVIPYIVIDDLLRTFESNTDAMKLRCDNKYNSDMFYEKLEEFSKVELQNQIEHITHIQKNPKSSKESETIELDATTHLINTKNAQTLKETALLQLLDEQRNEFFKIHKLQSAADKTEVHRIADTLTEIIRTIDNDFGLKATHERPQVQFMDSSFEDAVNVMIEEEMENFRLKAMQPEDDLGVFVLQQKEDVLEDELFKTEVVVNSEGDLEMKTAGLDGFNVELRIKSGDDLDVIADDGVVVENFLNFTELEKEMLCDEKDVGDHEFVENLNENIDPEIISLLDKLTMKFVNKKSLNEEMKLRVTPPINNPEPETIIPESNAPHLNINALNDEVICRQSMGAATPSPTFMDAFKLLNMNLMKDAGSVPEEKSVGGFKSFVGKFLINTTALKEEIQKNVLHQFAKKKKQQQQQQQKQPIVENIINTEWKYIDPRNLKKEIEKEEAPKVFEVEKPSTSYESEWLNTRNLQREIENKKFKTKIIDLSVPLSDTKTLKEINDECLRKEIDSKKSLKKKSVPGLINPKSLYEEIEEHSRILIRKPTNIPETVIVNVKKQEKPSSKFPARSVANTKKDIGKSRKKNKKGCKLSGRTTQDQKNPASKRTKLSDAESNDKKDETDEVKSEMKEREVVEKYKRLKLEEKSKLKQEFPVQQMRKCKLSPNETNPKLKSDKKEGSEKKTNPDEEACEEETTAKKASRKPQQENREEPKTSAKQTLYIIEEQIFKKGDNLKSPEAQHPKTQVSGQTIFLRNDDASSKKNLLIAKALQEVSISFANVSKGNEFKREECEFQKVKLEKKSAAFMCVKAKSEQIKCKKYPSQEIKPEETVCEESELKKAKGEKPKCVEHKPVDIKCGEMKPAQPKPRPSKCEDPKPVEGIKCEEPNKLDKTSYWRAKPDEKKSGQAKSVETEPTAYIEYEQVMPDEKKCMKIKSTCEQPKPVKPKLVDDIECEETKVKETKCEQPKHVKPKPVDDIECAESKPEEKKREQPKRVKPKLVDDIACAETKPKVKKREPPKHVKPKLVDDIACEETKLEETTCEQPKQVKPKLVDNIECAETKPKETTCEQPKHVRPKLVDDIECEETKVEETTCEQPKHVKPKDVETQPADHIQYEEIKPDEMKCFKIKTKCEQPKHVGPKPVDEIECAETKPEVKKREPPKYVKPKLVDDIARGETKLEETTSEQPKHVKPKPVQIDLAEYIKYEQIQPDEAKCMKIKAKCEEPKQVEPKPVEDIECGEAKLEETTCEQPKQVEPKLVDDIECAETKPEVRKREPPKYVKPKLVDDSACGETKLEETTCEQPKHVKPTLVETEAADYIKHEQMKPDDKRLKTKAKCEQPKHEGPKLVDDAECAETKPEEKKREQPKQVKPKLVDDIECAETKPKVKKREAPKHVKPKLVDDIVCEETKFEETTCEQPKQVKPKLVDDIECAETKPKEITREQPKHVKSKPVETEPADYIKYEQIQPDELKCMKIKTKCEQPQPVKPKLVDDIECAETKPEEKKREPPPKYVKPKPVDDIECAETKPEEKKREPQPKYVKPKLVDDIASGETKLEETTSEQPKHVKPKPVEIDLADYIKYEQIQPDETKCMKIKAKCEEPKQAEPKPVEDIECVETKPQEKKREQPKPVETKSAEGSKRKDGRPVENKPPLRGEPVPEEDFLPKKIKSNPQIQSCDSMTAKNVIKTPGKNLVRAVTMDDLFGKSKAKKQQTVKAAQQKEVLVPQKREDTCVQKVSDCNVGKWVGGEAVDKARDNNFNVNVEIDLTKYVREEVIEEAKEVDIVEIIVREKSVKEGKGGSQRGEIEESIIVKSKDEELLAAVQKVRHQKLANIEAAMQVIKNNKALEFKEQKELQEKVASKIKKDKHLLDADDKSHLSKKLVPKIAKLKICDINPDTNYIEHHEENVPVVITDVKIKGMDLEYFEKSDDDKLNLSSDEPLTIRPTDLAYNQKWKSKITKPSTQYSNLVRDADVQNVDVEKLDSIKTLKSLKTFERFVRAQTHLIPRKDALVFVEKEVETKLIDVKEINLDGDMKGVKSDGVCVKSLKKDEVADVNKKNFWQDFMVETQKKEAERRLVQQKRYDEIAREKEERTKMSLESIETTQVTRIPHKPPPASKPPPKLEVHKQKKLKCPEEEIPKKKNIDTCYTTDKKSLSENVLDAKHKVEPVKKETKPDVVVSDLLEMDLTTDLSNLEKKSKEHKAKRIQDQKKLDLESKVVIEKEAKTDNELMKKPEEKKDELEFLMRFDKGLPVASSKSKRQNEESEMKKTSKRCLEQSPAYDLKKIYGEGKEEGRLAAVKAQMKKAPAADALKTLMREEEKERMLKKMKPSSQPCHLQPVESLKKKSKSPMKELANQSAAPIAMPVEETPVAKNKLNTNIHNEKPKLLINKAKTDIQQPLLPENTLWNQHPKGPDMHLLKQEKEARERNLKHSKPKKYKWATKETKWGIVTYLVEEK